MFLTGCQGSSNAALPPLWTSHLHVSSLALNHRASGVRLLLPDDFPREATAATSTTNVTHHWGGPHFRPNHEGGGPTAAGTGRPKDRYRMTMNSSEVDGDGA